MSTPIETRIWIGLDVGKEFHYAVVLDNGGKVIFEQRVDNSEVEITKLFDKASSLGVCALAIDQPGSIAQLGLGIAHRYDIPVAYIPGLVMRRAADLYPGESKTDRRDAYVIADTARTRSTQIHWLSIEDELLVQLRILNGLDTDLAMDATRCSNRLRDLMTSVSPSLERYIGTLIHHGGVLDLLAKYPTPQALRKISKTRIEKVVAVKSPRMASKVSEKISKALSEQSISVPAEKTLGRVISELAVELSRLYDRRQQLEHDIEEVFLSHPLGKVLISLPGVGIRTGARILSEIGDGSDFDSAAKLAAYAGLARVARQSGTSIKGQHRSRRGNHRLKNAMFLSAFASLHDPCSRAFYDRKRSEGKRHNAAVICLARRRCDVIFAMLRDVMPYAVKEEIGNQQKLKKAA